MQKSLKLKRALGISGTRDQLYFGYGANLSIERFTSRKMNVADLGNAVLKHYKIKFSLANEYKGKGYAGIHSSPGDEVWGVLYSIDSHSLKLLDAMEWAGFGSYERRRVEVFQTSGKKSRCWAYFVKSPRENLFPSKQYVQNMVKAAKERNFPEVFIEFLEKQEYREAFELDHSFSLLFYGRTRPFARQLRGFYRVHDKLREKLCDLI